jgi:hypothetical protein
VIQRAPRACSRIKIRGFAARWAAGRSRMARIAPESRKTLATPEPRSETSIARGTTVRGRWVSSARSAEASKPVRHHAPTRSERAQAPIPAGRPVAALRLSRSTAGEALLAKATAISTRLRASTPRSSVHTPTSVTREARRMPERWTRAIEAITASVSATTTEGPAQGPPNQPPLATWRRPWPKLAKTPVKTEMSENATAKLEKAPMLRRSCCR